VDTHEIRIKRETLFSQCSSRVSASLSRWGRGGGLALAAALVAVDLSWRVVELPAAVAGGGRWGARGPSASSAAGLDAPLLRAFGRGAAEGAADGGCPVSLPTQADGRAVGGRPCCPH